MLGVQINISIVKIFDDGYGDLATNLLMAQHLRVLWPDATINVLVDSESEKAMPLFFPRFDLQKDSQMIDGITYVINLEKGIPEADYFLSFSNPNTVLNISKHVPSILFSEYSGGSKLVVGKGSFSQLKLNAGVESSGLYITPTKVPPPVPRKSLFEVLRREGIQIPKNLDPNNVLIGYSYTTLTLATQLYLDAVSRLPSQGVSKKIVLFVKDFGRDTLDVPDHSNIVTIPLKGGASFMVSRSIVAHSDITIMVTGDVSPSIAIDFEVPFLYEIRRHKAGFIDSLARLLNITVPFSIEAEVDEVASSEVRYRVTDIEQIVPLLLGDSFRQSMINGIKNFRIRLSLPLFVIHVITELQKELIPTQVKGIPLSTVMRVASKFKQDSQPKGDMVPRMPKTKIRSSFISICNQLRDFIIGNTKK